MIGFSSTINVNDMTHYSTAHKTKVSTTIAKSIETSIAPKPDLSKPACRLPDGSFSKFYAIGTTHPDGFVPSSHYVIVDTQDCQSIAPVSAAVNDVRIVSNGVLVGLDSGCIDILTVGPDSVSRTSSVQVHASGIVEMAPKPSLHHKVVSIGNDFLMKTTDISSESSSVSEIVNKLDDQNKSFTTIKWSRTHADALFCGIDDVEKNSTLCILDDRSNLSLAASYDIPLNRSGLYTVEPVDEHNVLLGFEGGEIQLLDVRNGALLASAWDPFVTAVGDIEYNGVDAFVTSGSNDFTVWKLTDGVANVYAHSKSSTSIRSAASNYEMRAAWVDDDTVFASDNMGFVGRYAMSFKRDTGM